MFKKILLFVYQSISLIPYREKEIEKERKYTSYQMLFKCIITKINLRFQNNGKTFSVFQILI